MTASDRRPETIGFRAEAKRSGCPALQLLLMRSENRFNHIDWLGLTKHCLSYRPARMRVVRVGLLRPGPIDKAGHAGRGSGLGYLFRCSSPIVDGGPH